MADKSRDFIINPQYDFFDYSLKSPFSYSLFGSSQSGKSYFIRQFIKKLDEVIDRKTSHIFYFYNKWQKEFDDLLEKYSEKIEFIQGIVTTKWVEENLDLPPSSGRKSVPLIIVDDGGRLITEDTVQVFQIAVHHYFFNLLFSFHSLYSNRPEHRAISLNSSYLHIQKNTRDVSFVSVLAKQIEGVGNSRRFIDIYKEATSNPYSYLLVDLRQTTPRSRQLRGYTLHENSTPLIVYERID